MTKSPSDNRRSRSRTSKPAPSAPSETTGAASPPPAPKGKQVTPEGVEAARAGKLRRIGGSMSDDFNKTIANQAVQSHWYGNSDQTDSDQKGMAALGAMCGIGPQDEIEGMLAAQMIATHNATMECHRRAMIQTQPGEAREQCLNQATRLTRSFISLMQALDKRRGKGQQKVTVEHVHVHQGGQAIVGNVTHEQRIAAEATVRQVTHATGAVLPGTDDGPILEGVPGGGGVSRNGD